MTEEGRGNDGWGGVGGVGGWMGIEAGTCGWCTLASSHPPPNLPPKRGEG